MQHRVAASAALRHGHRPRTEELPCKAAVAVPHTPVPAVAGMPSVRLSCSAIASMSAALVSVTEGECVRPGASAARTTGEGVVCAPDPADKLRCDLDCRRCSTAASASDGCSAVRTPSSLACGDARPTLDGPWSATAAASEAAVRPALSSRWPSSSG